MKVERAAEAEMMPGLLKQAPDWLCMLVQTLSGRDRLHLFQVCKQLANIVMQSAPNVTLDIKAPEYSTPYLELRRRTITNLLDVERDFQLVLRGAGLQPRPYPTQLSSHVTAIKVPCTDDGPGKQASFAWEMFKNLQQLEWCRPMVRRDIDNLCDAVTGGQLQQLRSFVFKNPEAVHWVSCQALDHLIHVLGPRLSHLATDDTELLAHLPRFTQLHSVTISGAVLQCTAARHLCEHPQLRTVTLRHCFIWGDHSQCDCKWEILNLEGTRLREGALLPLQGLKQIHFVGVVPQRPLLAGVHQEQQQRPEFRVLCEPAFEQCYHGDSAPATEAVFKLDNLSPEVVRLLPHLKAASNGCVLHLDGAIPDGMSQQPDLLSALWRSLPPCVHGISFNCLLLTGCIGWQQLWHSLPQTVTEVSFEGCDTMPLCPLTLLVDKAPAHLTTIRFLFATSRVLDDWEANGMRMIAPKHVQVEMSVLG